MACYYDMKTLNEAAFSKRYQELNPQQKEAVDTIYGPVMVIAGPGTGKTEVLAMRIANLLRSDAQVKPHEILCLTFTDEGAVAMRTRLLSIVGEQAHKINIYTFHSFCNSIIQSQTEYFGWRDLQPISDLEKMDLVYDIIENLEQGHLLRKLKGNLHQDAKSLIKFFSLMKTEDWPPQRVNDAIDSYLKSLPENEKYIYKRGNDKAGIKAGDPKTNDIEQETKRMERTRAAAMLYPLYDERMKAAGWYDFDDMILWVLKAFKERPEFLQSQQERFQFFLVDEFQDTNGAQYELLCRLADYWQDPNVFIVGDDDQSIFEFQGARLGNIIDYVNKYESSIKVITLTENYRSSQLILDKAKATIDNNLLRLVNQTPKLQLQKNITSANKRFQTEDCPKPQVTCYTNTLQEELQVVKAIEALHQSGVPLHQVAVLYAQHKQVDNIIALMERKKLPYWVRKPVNILTLPIIRQLINLLQYLQAEYQAPLSGEEWIFSVLHSPFFEVSPIDIATLCLYLQEKQAKHNRWRFLLQDALLLETLPLERSSALRNLGENIERWIKELPTLTLPMLIQKLLYDGGVVPWVMKGENSIWEMQVLHTFFEFIKTECEKKPRISIKDLLDIFSRMEKEGIPLSIQRTVQQNDGVRFYTVYSAKGHEFEHVFMIGLTKNFWEKKNGDNKGFSLPDTLTMTADVTQDVENSVEVARRLFYVAMTRAKKYLYVSYSKQDNKSKPLEATMFIDEISSSEERTYVETEDIAIAEHIAAILSPAPTINNVLAKKELIDKRLENFSLSVSTMNKYLRCPLSFYFEQILRVPEAKSDALAFGIAIHFALEQLFKKMSADAQQQFPSKEIVIKDFEYSMRRQEGAFTPLQYQRRVELGAQVLSEYYDEYIAVFNKIAITEYNISSVTINGVPAKGKVDKIEFDGHNCVVVDYKTGNSDYSKKSELKGPNDANPNGGDYWRQMIFYKLLLENYPAASGWHMTAGIFDFVEKNKSNKFIRITIPIQEQDVTFVKHQIKDVYTRIQQHEFEEGCNDENCRWCKFAKTYHLTAAPEMDILI